MNKPRALIVDDEEDICFLMKGILGTLNFNALSTGSLKEAFELMNPNSFAVVFLDINLNDGSGLEAIKKIKKNIGEKCIIIMISAFDGQAERGIANQRGADYFIGKPLSKEKIIKGLVETNLMST